MLFFCQNSFALSHFLAIRRNPARATLACMMRSAPHQPLSALLSQILVAYTVELDSEFERRMLETRAVARLSLVIWLNVLQFLADGPVSVRTLASRALAGEEQG